MPQKPHPKNQRPGGRASAKAKTPKSLTRAYTAQTTYKKPAPGATPGAVPLAKTAESRLLPRGATNMFPSSAPFPDPKLMAQSDSVITPQRLAYFKLVRWSPLRTLTPDLLGQYFDLFEQGYLRYLALLLYYMTKRDPILASVINKRKGAVTRLKVEVLTVPNIKQGQKAEADAHREFLQSFYDNVRVSSAVDGNLEAGMSALLEQMLSALEFKWAAHEIIWQPQADGTLSARFNFIPLWFFENRIGKLRFLEMDYQIDGRDLEPNSFLLTCGPGLMEPCAVCYLYKTLAQKWWLRYMEGHASPVKVGITNSPRGSTNFVAMQKAMTELVDSILLNKEEDFKKLDIAASGELPYLPMVDEMNRMMATIWRGADLSTISGKTSQGGQGALLQGKEEFNLQSDDASRLTETLNFQVDTRAIEWKFGAGTKPLAYVKVVVPPLVDRQSEIALINAFRSWGIDVGKDQVRDEFGRAEMPEGDEPLTPLPVADPNAGGGGAGGASAQTKNQSESKQYSAELEEANERRAPGLRRVAPDVDAKLLTVAKTEIARAKSEGLAPLADAIDAVLALPDEARGLGYQRFRSSLPELLARINRNPKDAPVLARAMASAWFNGITNAEVTRAPSKK